MTGSDCKAVAGTTGFPPGVPGGAAVDVDVLLGLAIGFVELSQGGKLEDSGGGGKLRAGDVSLGTAGFASGWYLGQSLSQGGSELGSLCACKSPDIPHKTMHISKVTLIALRIM